MAGDGLYSNSAGGAAGGVGGFGGGGTAGGAGGFGGGAAGGFGGGAAGTTGGLGAADPDTAGIPVSGLRDMGSAAIFTLAVNLPSSYAVVMRNSISTYTFVPGACLCLFCTMECKI